MRLIAIMTMTLSIVLAAYIMGWSQTGRGIQLKATAEVEAKTRDAEGRPAVVRVPAEKVIPGTQVIYTIQYSNTGDQPAENVSITNPIPENMRYVPRSAFGPDTAITFSIDNGKTFDRPEKLKIVDQEGRSHPAEPGDYTHIRWIIGHPIAPQATGKVGFRAALE